MKKKLLEAKIATSLTAVSLLVALIVYISLNGSVAWFSNAWRSDDPVVSFQAGGSDALAAIVWTWTGDEQSGEWESSYTEEINAEAHPMKTLETTVADSGVITSIKIESLQLGMVDNLVDHNKANAIYVRVNMGSMRNADINLSYDSTDGIKLYKVDSDTDTEINLSEPTAAVDLSAYNFLQYQYCISNISADPDSDSEWLATDTDAATPAAADTALVFSEPVPFSAVTAAAADEALTGEPLYLYIKITPNLTEFGKASQTLNTYMPCVVLFDATIDIGAY